MLLSGESEQKKHTFFKKNENFCQKICVFFFFFFTFAAQKLCKEIFENICCISDCISKNFS